MGDKAGPGYDQLLRRAATLDPADQLLLLSDLVAMLRQRIEQSPAGHAIAELRDLGKNIWHGIDAQEYVERERAA
jgi:hypothetical protein